MVMFNNTEKQVISNNAEVTGMETERRKRRMTVSNFYAVPRNPPSASALPIFDEAHIRNAMARFNQTKMTPEERKTAINKIIRAASKHGINSSAFKSKYERRLSEEDDSLDGRVTEEVETDVFSV